MRAIYYRWSGNHKTILDIENTEVTLAMYLNIAIDQQKEYFKRQVRQDPTATRWLYRIKREIRDMKQLADVLSKVVYDEAITDQREAAKKAYAMIMPYADN